jgi:hypothetical protein
VGASTAVKFGDIGTGRRFGDVVVGIVSDAKFGETEVVVVDEAKFGDVDTGGKWGEIVVERTDGMKFGDVAANDADMRLGDMGAVAVTAGKLGDIDFVGMRGRKFGDNANESVRFGVESEVATRAGRSGDVDVCGDSVVSCTDVLGQVASAPSSIGS